MRKEVIIAIIIGFLIGLVITYGVHTANKAVKETTVPSPATTNKTANEKTIQETNHTISISSPDNYLATSSASINIEGQTTPESVIIIFSEKGEYFTQTTADGNFTSKINLAPGLNQLTINSISKDYQETQTKLDLIYSTQLELNTEEINENTKQSNEE